MRKTIGHAVRCNQASITTTAALAVLLGMSACGSKSTDPPAALDGDHASNTCGDFAPCSDAAMPATKTPDAGAGGSGGSGDAGAGKPMPQPTGHPAPMSTACAPVGPTKSELGSKLEVLYSGERQLAQVSTKHDQPLVADSRMGILRYVGGATLFERVVAAQTPSFLEADLSVYWSANASVLKASLSSTNGAPVLVADGQPPVIAFLTYDQDNLYFADPNYRKLTQQPLSGEASRTLVAAVDAADMKLVGGYVYYSESATQQVYRIKVDDEDLVTEPLTDGMNTVVQALAVGDGTLYFADDTQIFSTPVDGSAQRTPVGQAGPGTLGRGRITRMKLMGDRLFWQDDVGSIGWTAIDGSECALVMRGEGAVPRGWDVDESAVYVTAGDADTTSLWRIAR